jgi:aspartyl-tRNA(Asn)/glutamyl-tRNA(Gln) amidotransferase subunit C
MSIDKNTVGKIARLARIRVSDADQEVLSGELSKIMTMIEELGQVDTGGVAPMTSVVQMKMQSRKDAVTDGGIAGKILANAPEQTAGFFVVPKIVE